MKTPFNRPHLTQNELTYIKRAHSLGSLAGDGEFTKKCHSWIEAELGSHKALLTHSCTAALEMMAILADIQPGDEVIMPSYTFVSTANAFALRGGVPVFVDIRPDTFNLDENQIEAAITEKTKAIVPVHYAGISCEMDRIEEIANKHSLLILEDAAQGFLSQYKGRNLGTIGDLGAYSFHETKNIISGEGGALSINNPRFAERAEIIREKGTNRSKFFRGQVDKYTWVDIGSSYLPGEIIAAFLFAQLEKSRQINTRRIQLWQRYFDALMSLQDDGLIRLPIVPEHCVHNGHLFAILLADLEKRTQFISFLKEHEVLSVFHYVPLHSSPGGEKYGRADKELVVTNDVSDRLVRLPLFYDLDEAEQDRIIKLIFEFFGK